MFSIQCHVCDAISCRFIRTKRTPTRCGYTCKYSSLHRCIPGKTYLPLSAGSSPSGCQETLPWEHYKRTCPGLLLKSKGKWETTENYSGGKAGSGGGAGQTWCSHHNTTTHSDFECYAQGAPCPQQRSPYTACSTHCSHPSPDGDTKKLELNFGRDLDGDFLFTSTTTARTFIPNIEEAATPVEAYGTEPVPSLAQELLSIIAIAVTGIITIARGLWELLTHSGIVVEKKTLTASAFPTFTNVRTFQPNSDEMTMLVNSGDTEHVLDDELITGLKDRMMNPTPLEVPKTITTAGNRKLLGTMTGTIDGTITDETGRTHRAHFPSRMVSVVTSFFPPPQ